MLCTSVRGRTSSILKPLTVVADGVAERCDPAAVLHVNFCKHWSQVCWSSEPELHAMGFAWVCCNAAQAELLPLECGIQPVG
eukprot:2423168-Amphidinium_carterae.1